MARSDAARVRQGLSSNGKVTRTRREVGQYGNTRPREDASVRRARQMETDPRLLAAKAAQEKAEAELRALEAKQAKQAKQAQVAEWVERSTREQGVPLKVTDPATLKKVAALWVPEKKAPPVPQPAESSWQQLDSAHDLLSQGYHVTRVAERTGVAEAALRHFVGNDGYAKNHPTTTTRN